jgi:type 2 lantibiotic biosynthesis protein LanM
MQPTAKSNQRTTRDLETLFESAEWYRGLSLQERLATLRESRARGQASPAPSDDLLIERLRKWREQQAFGESRLADNSNALYGCSIDELGVLLAEPAEAIKDRSQAPAWLVKLSATFTADLDWRVPESLLTDHGDAHLLACAAPLVRAAEDELTSRLRSLTATHANLPFEASEIPALLLPGIVPALLTMLRPTLVLELNASRLRQTLRGATPEERYADFISALASPAYSAAILHRYPVLARLVVTRLDAWVDATSECLTRLATDWPRMRDHFKGWRSSDQLVEAAPLGDPHRGGRRVLHLRFSSGFELIYKPRPLAAELHFQSVLGWLGRHTSSSFRLLKVFDRGAYGWEEVVHQSQCETTVAVRSFYRRQGALLTLLRVMGAVDIHFDNLVACGEYPVLIDLEPLFHRVIPPFLARLRSAERVAAEVTSNSVIYVGLLPYRVLYGGGNPGVDMSGLGADAATVMPVRGPVWDESGTDQMHQELRHLALGRRMHRPLPDDGFSLSEFTDDVVAGFSDAYRALIDCKHEPIQGELSRFAHDETRCLFRPTLAYALMLLSSYHPHFLGDGLVRDRRFDKLLADSERLPSSAKMIKSERADLWNGDVPAFTTRTDSRHLWDSRGEAIENVLPETGLEQSVRRLRQLDDEDLSRESWIIRMAIATSVLSEDAPTPRLYSVDSEKPLAKADKPTQQELLLHVHALIERLMHLAITADRNATWIGVRSRNGVDWWVDPIGPDLYDGLAGIAFFLAHAGHLLSDSECTALARASLATMLRQIDETRKRDDVLVGGFSGIGGNLYTLVHLGVLWEDTELVEQASHLVRLLPRWIDSDSRLDVAAGTAGCIPPLLALARIAQSDEALSAAVRCGNHLLSRASVMPIGIGWIRPELGPRPLAGFAHGSGGVAWALLQLGTVTGESHFIEAGMAAIAYERTLFSPQVGNWLDLRERHNDSRLAEHFDDLAYMSYWCNGSAGIGLARLRCLDHFEDDQFCEEIGAAIEATLRGFGLNHSLCHGDLGNMEFLAEAKSFVAELNLDADGVLAQVLASMRLHGYICGHPGGLESPGLMMGLAGIGYGLLRQAFPDDAPCALLLEPPNVAVGERA